MTKSVYLHRAVFGFEALMRQTLMLLRDAGKLWSDGSAIAKLVRHPTRFLEFHDGYIDALISEHAQGSGSRPLQRLCRAIRDRKPPVLLLEVASLTSSDEAPAEELTRLIARRKDQIHAVAKKVRIPIECWLWEDPKDIAFEKLGPVVNLGDAVDVSPEDIAELIYVADGRGKTRALVEDKSSVLYHLSRLKFQMGRLYVLEDDSARVVAARREVEAWLK
jgi:hypothetical protein